MKNVLLLVIAALLPTYAFATTWYIRPAGGTYGTGDGRSYANAYSGIKNGLSNTRLVGGDTLFLCGAHYEQMTWNKSGSSNAPILVDFGCPGNPGSIDTVAAGQPYNVYIANVRFVTFTNMRLLGALRNAIRLDATLQNVSDVKITNSYIDNKRATDSTRKCHAVYISPAGTSYRLSNIEISHNTVTGASRGCFNGNNDGINFEGGISGNVITGNTVSYGHEGIDITSAGTQITFNTVSHNYYSGIKVHGIIQCPKTMFLYNNRIFANAAWGIIFQDASDSIISNNTVSQTSSTYAAIQIDKVNSCSQSNNTYTNNIFVSNYAAGAVRIYDESKATFESQNNWNGNVIYQPNAASRVYLNTDVQNNVTSANFSTRWTTVHPRDKNENPNLTSTLRLPAGSPLTGAGITN